MNKVSLRRLPRHKERWVRPRGTYERASRYPSDRMKGGHPFGVVEVALAPGAINWPYHSHTRLWEMYLILRGTGKARTPRGWTRVAPGDCFMHPPREPHQLKNTGKKELAYLVICDRAPRDRTRIHSG